MSSSPFPLRTVNGIARHPVESAQELVVALSHIPDLFRRRRLVDGHRRHLSMDDVRVALADASDRFGIPATWVASDVVPTVSDVAVIQVGEPDHPFSAFLKIAQSPSAEEGLAAQAGTLMALQNDDALGDWRRLLPTLLADGETGGRRFEIEQALSGVPVTSLVRSKQWRPALLGSAVSIRELHAARGETKVVDESLLDSWIDDALSVISSLPTTWSANEQQTQVERLRIRLQRGLLGRAVNVTRIHGDFSPNNVLADSVSGRITGILDWDRSVVGYPAFVDVGQFALEAQRLQSGDHLGAVVRSVCENNRGFTQDEGIVDSFWLTQNGDRVDDSIVALMALLHHVKSNIQKAPRYASHRLWIFRTVELVLGNLPE